MTTFLNGLVTGLADPVELFGHFTYFLLIVSMLMRRMVWLRAFAVASGIAKIVYRAFFVFDPVSVLWETIFVLVNIGQLVVIWYYDNHHRFADDDGHFAANMPPSVERSAIKKLLEHADLERYAVGDVLTRQGEPVASLMYIADGIVKIESEGHLVAILSPGDYVGELSYLSGKPANATATVVMPVRLLAFDQQKLKAATRADPLLQRTLESALNRNLAGKLTRSNETVVSAETA